MQVAAMAPNIPELYELHFAVPMAGAIICPLNTKLDAPTLASLLQRLEPKIIFVDSQYLPIVFKSVSQNGKAIEIVSIPDDTNAPLSKLLDYNRVLEMRFEDFTPKLNGELDPISINCTSGSTGLHKSVIYSHRATYLNSLATISRTRIFTSTSPPVFLWTVDMFRCNGWCFIWAMAALGGCNICLRTVTADAIFNNIKLHKVTLLCGPTTLLKMISESPNRTPLSRRVDLVVAGALPIPQILTKVTEFGFDISHGYGMTEALGPAIIKPYWKKPNYDIEAQNFEFEDLITSLEIDVKDPISMESILADGETLGEVMLRGNTLMSGYYKNFKATCEAFNGDWYRTGDVAIKHMSGTIEMKDRAKDIVVTADGAVVSTVDVEAVLMSHPKVVEAAVVVGLGKNLLCGLIKLKNGSRVSVEEIVEFCRAHLPEFMVPQRVVFGDLPMNSTGKVQKFVVREKVKEYINE